jgi:predicted nucleic acid-binding protein
MSVVLVDTSVWVDHLRRQDPGLHALLVQGRVLGHPFIVGEIACGTLRNRDVVIPLMQDLPQAPVAEPAELLGFIEAQALHGLGIGYVDVHLLASAVLRPGTRLWTRDKRLLTVAQRLNLALDEPSPH